LLTFVPVAGPDAVAIIKARDAALIQVGATEQWGQVSRAVEKATPKTIKHAATMYGAAHEKKVRFRFKQFEMNAQQNKALVTFTINF